MEGLGGQEDGSVRRVVQRVEELGGDGDGEDDGGETGGHDGQRARVLLVKEKGVRFIERPGGKSGDSSNVAVIHAHVHQSSVRG